MRIFALIVASISLISPGHALASQTEPRQNSAYQTQSVIPVGTYITIRVVNGLFNKGGGLKPGQRFQIETVSPLMAGNTIVVPVGTKGEGEVLSAKESNMLWAGKGHIDARAVSLNLRGRKIRLNGSLDNHNRGGGKIAQGATFLVCLDEDLFFVLAGKRNDDPLPDDTVKAPPATVQNEMAATMRVQQVPVYPYDLRGQPYEIIGPIEARVRKASLFHNSADQLKIYDELWERAQKLGADAVINAKYGDGALGGTAAVGTAIRFKQNDGTAVVPDAGSALQ